MAKKSVSTLTKIKPSGVGKRSRIRIGQPEYRLQRLRKRDVVRWPEVSRDPWWFVLHKRGVRRSRVGLDQLEARAVSPEYIKGTLPERIVWKYLVDYLKMQAGVDFDFQSSLEGGRIELGGMVVDFLFPLLRIIIQVDGPTHDSYQRKGKDEEQENELAARGYRVFRIEDTVIYDVYMFEEYMRRLFGLGFNVGGSGGAHGSLESNYSDWERIMQLSLEVQDNLIFQFGV